MSQQSSVRMFGGSRCRLGQKMVAWILGYEGPVMGFPVGSSGKEPTC